MEKYFNPTRFSKYFRYNLSIHYKAYFITCIVLLIALTIANYLLLCGEHNYNPEFHTVVFTICFCSSSFLIIGTGFPELRSKSKTIYFLTIPASIFEKYLVQFFIRIICFPVFYFVLFWLSLKFAHHFYMLTDYNKHYIIYDYSIFSSIKQAAPQVMYLIVLFIITLCLFLFAGSAIYRKHALFKTVFSVMTFLFGIYILLLIYSHIFNPEVTHGFYPELQPRNVYQEYNTMVILMIAISCITNILLLPLAYFKLKEKEL